MSNILSLFIYTIQKSFTLSARSNRKEFAIFHMFYFVYGFFLLYLDKHYKHSIALLILANVVLLLFIPLYSLVVRRLHDIGASGWWILIFPIPFGLVLFFILLFKKGTPGPNKYGPPPEY